MDKVLLKLCAFYILVVCRFLSLSLSSGDAVDGHQWEVQAWVLESMLEPITGVLCRRRFSPLGQGDYSYDVELYASTKMLCFCKNVRFL
jgi:hypothetical protein